MHLFIASWTSYFLLDQHFCSTVSASQHCSTANNISRLFICLMSQHGNGVVPCVSSPRRSLPRLLGSPCILQERADGMYRKALQFPCCLSPWLGVRTHRDQTWACGSCGSPSRCDTNPLYLATQKRATTLNDICLSPIFQPKCTLECFLKWHLLCLQFLCI